MNQTSKSYELVLGVTVCAYATTRFTAENDTAAIAQARHELLHNMGNHVMKPYWESQEQDRIVTLEQVGPDKSTTVLQDVYAEAQPKAVEPDLHQRYVALVARVARVYLPGDIGANGIPVATEMSQTSVTATLRDLVEAARALNGMGTEVEPGTLLCPKCVGASKAAGSVFIEAGEWDGKQYEVEGSFDAHKCSSCGFTFAEVAMPVRQESAEVAA